MKIWKATEYILLDQDVDNLEGFYSTKEKAIEFVMDFINDYYESTNEELGLTIEDNDDCVNIITHFDEEKTGLYNCRYFIEEVDLDVKFGEGECV